MVKGVRKVDVGHCKLQSILYKRGISQAQLSDRTGISKTQISEYIHNRRTMSLATAKLIAITVKSSIDDLYEWEYKE